MDLESGQGAQAAPRAGGKGSDSVPVHEAQPVVSQAETVNETSSTACCCIPSGVFRPFTSIRGGSNLDHPQRNVNDTTGDQPTQAGQRPSRAEAQINPASEQKPEEPRMIGDFDGSANEFWNLYRKETKGVDDARIDTLNDGMGNALIFAGLFSAVLTGFVIDSKQSLKPSSADETVYYLRQHSAILSQISLQLSSIAPQVVIPSTPPPPFPPFSPLASDVRVNVFWFMALAFSLVAALLAILVQQWVRNYMNAFKRYADPLKSSRVRHYLFKGYEGWNMPRVADIVPGFLHISLFLFFAGLGHSLLGINTKVALTTIIPIGVTGLLYILITFAPIIHPQSPYQNSFSGIFWYLFQKLHVRRFRDRSSDGEMKSVSTNMAEGQMQLAMEETEARKDRDEQAIRWLIENLTEDAEMEKFLSAIPGSFNSDWGTDVWKRVGEGKSGDQSQDEPDPRPHRDTTAHQPSSSWSIVSVIRPIIHLVRNPTTRLPCTHATTHSPVPHPSNVHPNSTTAHIRENALYELSTRVCRSVKICKSRKLFSDDDDLWRKRTRTCIEVAALLVCCTNAEFSWFEGISKLLGDIGTSQKIRELSLAETDELFVIRWTCLSLVAFRPILEGNKRVQNWARRAMESFATEDGTGNEDALAGAQKIYETLQKARDGLYVLYDALGKKEDLTEEVIEVLRGHESQISELEQINIEADRFRSVDRWICRTQTLINRYQIISQFPGLLDDFDPHYDQPIPFSRFVEQSSDLRKQQFIRPAQTLKSMCSSATTLRNILEGKGNADAYNELLKNLETFRSSSGWQGDGIKDGMRRQLCRLQDLLEGGGFGFIVELFFLALKQPLSLSLMKSHSALYAGTFRTITSDWGKHKDSLGTQKLLLDIAMSHRTEFNFNDFYYPAFIVEEFLLLLGNIYEGQAGPHLDEAMQELTRTLPYWSGSKRFHNRLLKVITDVRAQSQS